MISTALQPWTSTGLRSSSRIWAPLGHMLHSIPLLSDRKLKGKFFLLVRFDAPKVFQFAEIFLLLQVNGIKGRLRFYFISDSIVVNKLDWRLSWAFRNTGREYSYDYLQLLEVFLSSLFAYFVSLQMEKWLDDNFQSFSCWNRKGILLFLHPGLWKPFATLDTCRAYYLVPYN